MKQYSVVLLLLLAVSAFAQSPLPNAFVGTQFTIFSNYSNSYVYVDPVTSQLTTTAFGSPAIFYVSTSSGGDGFTIINTATGLIVSAEGAGAEPLTASRTTKGRWESFFFNYRLPSGGGYYTITAQVNQQLVTVQADNTLIPNTLTASPQSILYLLTPAPLVPTPVPSPIALSTRVIIYSPSVGAYVRVDETFTTQLRLTATTAASASIFTVSSNSVGLSLYFTLTRLYVSASAGGAGRILANGNGPSGWESFTFNPTSTSGYYTITANANNGLWTAVASDNTIIPSSSPVDPPAPSTLFYITTPAV